MVSGDTTGHTDKNVAVVGSPALRKEYQVMLHPAQEGHELCRRRGLSLAFGLGFLFLEYL